MFFCISSHLFSYHRTNATALPGGSGPLEDFFEVYTWAKLGVHSKPCGLFNVNDYYAPLDALLDNAEREGFLPSVYRDLVIRADTLAEMLNILVNGRRSVWVAPF